MKIQMLKNVSAMGSFRKIGDVVDADEEQARELIRTGCATEAGEDKKPKKKSQYKV